MASNIVALVVFELTYAPLLSGWNRAILYLYRGTEDFAKEVTDER
jgi:hypothetical protein